MERERAIFNHIKTILKDYEKTDQYIKDRETELMHPFTSRDRNVGGGRSNVMHNTAETMAITIADDRRLSNLERNKRIVDDCLDRSDHITRTIITEWYIKPHSALNAQGVACLVNLSPEAVKKRRSYFFKMVREELGW